MGTLTVQQSHSVSFRFMWLCIALWNQSSRKRWKTPRKVILVSWNGAARRPLNLWHWARHGGAFNGTLVHHNVKGLFYPEILYSLSIVFFDKILTINNERSILNMPIAQNIWQSGYISYLYTGYYLTGKCAGKSHCHEKSGKQPFINHFLDRHIFVPQIGLCAAGHFNLKVPQRKE